MSCFGGEHFRLYLFCLPVQNVQNIHMIWLCYELFRQSLSISCLMHFTWHIRGFFTVSTRCLLHIITMKVLEAEYWGSCLSMDHVQLTHLFKYNICHIMFIMHTCAYSGVHNFTNLCIMSENLLELLLYMRKVQGRFIANNVIRSPLSALKLLLFESSI